MSSIDKPDSGPKQEREEALESEAAYLESAKEEAKDAVNVAERAEAEAEQEAGLTTESIDGLGTDEEIKELQKAKEERLSKVRAAKQNFMNEFQQVLPDVLRARVNEAASFLATGDNLGVEELAEEFALDPETARTYFTLAKTFGEKEKVETEEKGYRLEDKDEGKNKEEKGYRLESDNVEEEVPKQKDVVGERGPDLPQNFHEESGSEWRAEVASSNQESPKPPQQSEALRKAKTEALKEIDPEERMEGWVSLDEIQTPVGSEATEEVSESEKETATEEQVRSTEDMSLREIGRERMKKIGGLFSGVREKIKKVAIAGTELAMAAPEMAKRGVEAGVGAVEVAYKEGKELALDARDRLALEVNELIRKGVETVEKAKQAVVDAKDTTIEFGNRALYRASEKISQPFIRFQTKRMEGTVKRMNSWAERGKVRREDLEKMQKLLDHHKGLLE